MRPITGEKVVVELFSQLSDAHDNLPKVTKSISKLGQITNLEQFSFVLLYLIYFIPTASFIFLCEL